MGGGRDAMGCVHCRTNRRIYRERLGYLALRVLRAWSHGHTVLVSGCLSVVLLLDPAET